MTTENLIINGVDHAKFDLEWAKRGGCLICADAGSTIIFKFVRNIDPEKIEVTVLNGPDGLPVTNFWESKITFRMATQAECEAVGIEYIEPPTQWLPIESAPKDGTFFDVWNQRFKVRECNVRYVTGGFYVGGMRISSLATHWMPPPQPPKDE